MSPHFGGLCAIFIALSAAVHSSAASVDYKVRNAPGASTADTYLAVRNALAEASLQKGEAVQVNTTISRRWSDATLLKLGHERTAAEIQARPLDASGRVEIVCTECYVQGTAFAELSIGVNDTRLYIDQVIGNFTEDVKNVTEGFNNYIGVFGNFKDGIDWDDFELPTFNQDINFDIPEIPGCNLAFKFDGLELYMNMNTILGAGVTYELPLFRSMGPLGFHITDDLELGVFFTIDLILTAEGELDINNGFHIKLDDEFGIDITLFADDISDVTFNGGHFEFMPVTINSGSVVFSAVLRLGVHAGFQLVAPGLVAMSIPKFPAMGGGIEVGVFANVAEFITNVTYAPDDDDCTHNVVQSYQLALGARAGATVSIGNNTWGPMPETSVPIWYTEMGSICAEYKTPTTADVAMITTAPEDRRRQDLVTITTLVTFIHTGINCNEPGRVNCPASLQSTSQSTEIRTIVTALPPGAKFELPVTVMSSVPSPIAFKRGAESIPATSGSPASYIPPVPTETSKLNGFLDDLEDAADDAGNALDGSKETYKNNKPLIIGLASGLGGAALIAIIAALIFCQRRRAARQDIAKRGAYSAPEYAPNLVEMPATPAMSVGYMDYDTVKGAHVEEADLSDRSPSLRSP